MVEKSQGAAAEDQHATPAAGSPATGTTPPRRSGHRGMDPRETVAELTARAHEISQQAGSKVAAAMKDVIGAAAGLTGFAVESARDLIQYMVRRGQMTQMEGDKLLREVEAAHGTRSPSPKRERPVVNAAPTATPAPARTERKPANDKPPADKPPAGKSAAPKKAAEKPAKKAPAAKPAAKKAAAKSDAKSPAKGAATKGSASRKTASSQAKAAAKPASTKKKR